MQEQQRQEESSHEDAVFAPFGTFGAAGESSRSSGGTNAVMTALGLSAPRPGSGGTRTGPASAAGRRSTAGRRRRNAQAPSLLAGTCPVCRVTVKGGFLGGAMRRGVVGLRLKIGRPVDDPRVWEEQQRRQRMRDRHQASLTNNGTKGKARARSAIPVPLDSTPGVTNNDKQQAQEPTHHAIPLPALPPHTHHHSSDVDRMDDTNYNERSTESQSFALSPSHHPNQSVYDASNHDSAMPNSNSTQQ